MKYLPIWYRASCHLTMNKTLIRSVQLVTGGWRRIKPTKVSDWLGRWGVSAVTACHSMRLVAESSRVRPSLSPVNWWPDFTAGTAAFIEVRDLGTVSTGISSPGVRSGTWGLRTLMMMLDFLSVSCEPDISEMFGQNDWVSPCVGRSWRTLSQTDDKIEHKHFCAWTDPKYAHNYSVSMARAPSSK